MNLLIKHLLLICTASFSIAHAQPGSIYFDRITTQNGLSHNKVNCIMQDSRGFTWIGTEDGLNRFDGQNFVVYRNQPGNSIGGGVAVSSAALACDIATLGIAATAMPAPASKTIDIFNFIRKSPNLKKRCCTSS